MVRGMWRIGTDRCSSPASAAGATDVASFSALPPPAPAPAPAPAGAASAAVTGLEVETPGWKWTSTCFKFRKAPLVDAAALDVLVRVQSPPPAPNAFADAAVLVISEASNSSAEDSSELDSTESLPLPPSPPPPPPPPPPSCPPPAAAFGAASSLCAASTAPCAAAAVAFSAASRFSCRCSNSSCFVATSASSASSAAWPLWKGCEEGRKRKEGSDQEDAF